MTDNDFILNITSGLKRKSAHHGREAKLSKTKDTKPKSKSKQNNCESIMLTDNDGSLFSRKDMQNMFGGEMHPRLLSELVKNELTYPTKVQMTAIPLILNNDDRHIMIRSQTGTGKTLAYLLPLIQKLQAFEPLISRSDGPVAIILLPTKELSIQTFELTQKLLKAFVRIVPTYLIGGMNRKHEKDRIRKGVNVVIGTPGRIEDHLQNTSNFSLDHVRYFVMDEADRMLDMGFRPSMKRRKIIVFLSTNDSVRFHHALFSVLFNGTVEFYGLYGDLDTQSRQMARRDFSRTQSSVLLSTDVSARGLDFANVDWIVQYNCPPSLDEHVHRVGRTARLNRKGRAVIFVSDHESSLLNRITELCSVDLNEISKDCVLKRAFTDEILQYHKESMLAQQCSGFNSQCALKNVRLLVEKVVADNEDLQKLASTAYVSFVRSYSTFKHEWKSAFNPKKLHLTQVAKSFGLEDDPGNVAEQFLTRKKTPKTKQLPMMERKEAATLASEFESGL
ncbi:hypothetical protein ACOME3_005681 [Neoechinorhynchus agilis]